MKRKNYIFSLASALLMGTMALSLTACSSEDNIVNNTQQPAQGEVHTYTVSIPATFSDNAGTRAVEFDNSSTPAITAKFVENEKVYVFNNHSNHPQLLSGYLVVKNVSADMKSCELQGQLTGLIDPDDEVMLFYNLNNTNSSIYDYNNFYYDYNDQVGTAASCVDGAKATMKVKNIDASNNYKMTFYAVTDNTKTQAKAVFTNVQSMFRFQFADKDAPTTPIKVKTLNIQSKNVGLAQRRLFPFMSPEFYTASGGINVTPATATDDYLYVALCFDENNASDNELYFCVTDDAGNGYKGCKSAPTEGFKNGKYYYNTAPITLEKQSAPTITWTTPSTAVAADASFIYAFNVGADEDPDYDITVSGTCKGYAFDITSFGNTGTIRLKNLNATWKDANPTTPFISVTNGDVLFELTGANSITCNTYYAIHGGGNVKFSCTGASATLTVTASHSDFCGILGDSNYKQSQGGGADAYNNYPTTELYVTSQLAAPGYTVTRSARTANADGTYTWTYTVTPRYPLALSSATVDDLGSVACAAGHLHMEKAAVPAGCTAVGILGKVTETGHGLILSLQDATSQQWNIIDGWTSETTYAGTELKVLPDDAARGSLTSYTTLGSTAVSNWAVAQKSDYVSIFTNLGSTTENWGKVFDDNVNAYFTTGVGGSALSGEYWSATWFESDDCFSFDSNEWDPKTYSNTFCIRPVLAF